MSWEDKTEVKKGSFAEDIIHKYLESMGYIVYKPITDGAHGFDRLAMKDKKKLIYCEAKAKAKYNYYDYTGIDIKHYNTYKELSMKYNIPVFIFFVDEMLREIYGNLLSKLETHCEYPSHTKDRIVFYMDVMIRNIYKLNDSEVEYLKNNSTRNYEYVKVQA